MLCRSLDSQCAVAPAGADSGAVTLHMPDKNLLM